MKVYVIGSLRDAKIPDLAEAVRGEGHEVFDDWHACGPDADEHWRNYEIFRGRNYKEALASPFARHAFEFDKAHIEWADAVVLVAPAGKSAHLELGWALGQGKRGYILFDGEPERWDLMYLFATSVCYQMTELLDALSR